MRTIIAGSRDNVTQQDVDRAIELSGWSDLISVVVSGRARGADKMGEDWAKRHGIKIDPFVPNWRPNGVFDKSAGYKRNEEMAASADALIAVWDGKSSGTGHMRDIAFNKPMKGFIYYFPTGLWQFFNLVWDTGFKYGVDKEIKF